MDRQRRMRRTLLCLVVSMTVGAAFLDWIQPARSAPQASGTELIGRLTSSLRPPVGTGKHQWQSIYIDAQPGSVGDRQREPGNSSCHLIIDRGGRWSVPRDPASGQSPGTENVFRIGLLTPAHSNEITPAQWSAARELVYLLQAEWNLPGRNILVADTLAVPGLGVTEPAASDSSP